MESINQDIHDLDAILITHEHSDHIKGISVLSKNVDIPVYANKKTLDEIEKKRVLFQKATHLKQMKHLKLMI